MQQEQSIPCASTSHDIVNDDCDQFSELIQSSGENKQSQFQVICPPLLPYYNRNHIKGKIPPGYEHVHSTVHSKLSEVRHDKYISNGLIKESSIDKRKTEPCREFHNEGICDRGNKCWFQHLQVGTPNEYIYKKTSMLDVLLLSENSDPKQRLSVFRKFCHE